MTSSVLLLQEHMIPKWLNKLRIERWIKPLHRIKYNVHTANDKTGAVLRNWGGNFICALSSDSPGQSLLLSELRGNFVTLSWACNNDYSSFMVEVDSLAAYLLISRRQNTSLWNIKKPIDDILKLTSPNNISCTYCSSQVNVVASLIPGPPRFYFSLAPPPLFSLHCLLLSPSLLPTNPDLLPLISSSIVIYSD
ncbi:unnamed protein product, partial [Cuscuta epithymum]